MARLLHPQFCVKPYLRNFAITPSRLQGNFGSKYYDLRIFGKHFDDFSSYYVGIDDSEVMEADKNGIISIHSRIDIEQGRYNNP